MGCAAVGAAVVSAVADVGAFFAGVGGSIAGGLGIGGAVGIGDLTAGGLIGAGLEGATIGGVGGGLINAVTGKPILSGVGEGALLGGATGVLGPLVGGVTGFGATAADALAGAGVGAAGSAAFGGNPLTGALTGGAAGALSGALSSGVTGGAGGGATDAAGVGTGAGASGTAAPASVGAPVNLGGGDTFGVEAPSSPAIGGGLPGGTVASALPGTPISAPDAAGLQSQLALSQSGGPSQLALSSSAADGAGAPVNLGGGDTSGATGGGRPGIAPVDPVYSPASQTWGPGSITSGATPGEGGYAGSSGSSNSTYGDYSTPGVSHLLGASDPIVFSNGPAQSGSTDTGGGSSGGGGSHTNWSNFSNAPFGTLADAVGNNAAPLIAGGGLALSALRGNTPVAGQGALSAEAASLAANGATLQGYLSSGTLPAGVQQSIVQATDAAKASIRSRYAAMGQSGSSAEMQDLASVDQHAATQGATIATQLLNTGISETGLSEQIYANLLNAATQQNAQLGQAIGNFATSLAPSRPVVLQTQGSS